MNPQEKAKELIDTFEIDKSKKALASYDKFCIARRYASICVDEILKTTNQFVYGQGERVLSENYMYWSEVKQEIYKI